MLVFKKIMLGLVLTYLSSITSWVSAADMSCFIPSASPNEPVIDDCTSFVTSGSSETRLATWEIVNIDNTIREIIWQDVTFECSPKSIRCSVQITPNEEHVGTAVILYDDDTFEVVSAIARFILAF